MTIKTIAVLILACASSIFAQDGTFSRNVELAAVREGPKFKLEVNSSLAYDSHFIGRATSLSMEVSMDTEGNAQLSMLHLTLKVLKGSLDYEVYQAYAYRAWSIKRNNSVVNRVSLSYSF